MRQFKNVEIILEESEAVLANSLYIIPLGNGKAKAVVTDGNGNKVSISSDVPENTDQTLRINGNIINSNVGITESNFYNQTVITLPFVPAQILGVFVGGLKLPDTGAYTLTLPHTIQFHVNTQGKHINVQFSYLLT